MDTSEPYIGVDFIVVVFGKMKKHRVWFFSNGSSIYIQARAQLVKELGTEEFRIMSWKQVS